MPASAARPRSLEGLLHRVERDRAGWPGCRTRRPRGTAPGAAPSADDVDASPSTPRVAPRSSGSRSACPSCRRRARSRSPSASTAGTRRVSTCRLRDAPGAEREEDGQDDRELLGQHRHGERDAREEALEPVAPRRAVEPPPRRAEQEPRAARSSTMRAISSCRGVLPARARRGRCRCAHLGARRRGHDLARARSLHHQGAREDEGLIVATRARVQAALRRVARLRTGHRLAGEERLVDRRGASTR